MVGESLVLRVRTKSGILRINNLSLKSSLKDLKKSIASVAGLDETNFKILFGYPPKQLTTTNENTSLEKNSIRNGEIFTLEETKTSQVSCPVRTNSQICRKVVPADNSCLFTSINYLMSGVLDLNCQKDMRELIAKTVRNNPIEFNEGILGKSNSAYCDWIRNSTSWGGSIEIIILSKYYKIEICVVDIRTCRIDRFGEDCSYPKRIFLLYDGIHFDPIHLVMDDDHVQTQFTTLDDITFVKAISLAEEAKNSRQFTDVNNFKLRCLACQEPLVGEKQAQEHAKNTGHINFGEF